MITIASTAHVYRLIKPGFMCAGCASFISHIIPNNNTGSNGGYIKKLSEKFPSSNNEKDRCTPQVGQSIPNSSLYAQGSIIISNTGFLKL